MSERWVFVTGYAERYEVSDAGRVRSLDFPDTLGRPHRGRILKQTKDDYPHVNLYKDGKKRTLIVSHLVAEAFLGSRPPGLNVCHNDGDPRNNNWWNLRWDTQSSNILDKHKHGTDWQLNKKKCPAGHDYTPENTYRIKRSDGREERQCRTCRLAYVKDLRKRKKQTRKEEHELHASLQGTAEFRS